MPSRRGSATRALALFRIALSIIFFISSERHDAMHVARTPRALWIAPSGLDWFLHVAPITERTVTVASGVYLTAAACSVVGLYTRAALTSLFVSASYLFAVRQLSGAVLHDMHLLWFLALLLASRGAPRISLDAWLTRASPLSTGDAERSAQASLFWVRTLLGLIYFFPGLWKVRSAGLHWALSDNLANQMHAKWFEYGAVPSLRLDRYPTLLGGLGLATIAFELGFIFLVHIGPRVRFALLVAGLLFHWTIEWQMKIPFASLWVCYTALLGPPVRGLAPLWRSRGARVVSMVGGAIALCVFERGSRGATQSFPFACYPTFQSLQGETLPDVYAAHRDARGAHYLDLRKGRTQQEWGEVWSVLGIAAPYSEAKLQAYLDTALPKDAPRPLEVGVGQFRTAPEHWGKPPTSARPLLTLH